MGQPKDTARQKLVSVYTAGNEMEARMVQGVLANAGIESAINAELAPGLYPATLGPWAKHEILVIESAAAEAARILSELPASSPPAPSSEEQE